MAKIPEHVELERLHAMLNRDLGRLVKKYNLLVEEANDTDAGVAKLVIALSIMAKLQQAKADPTPDQLDVISEGINFAAEWQKTHPVVVYSSELNPEPLPEGPAPGVYDSPGMN